jgi:7,8-dihydro-6-hydroxymethylpterin-pyrophosphokinase
MQESINPIKLASRIWRTIAYSSTGPDFLTVAVKLKHLSIQEFKGQVIFSIETALKDSAFPIKMRQNIDIDIIISMGRSLITD